jgi:hypothetical protein
MAKASRVSHSGEKGKSDAFSVDLEQSMGRSRQEQDTPLPLRWWVGKDDVLRRYYSTYRAAILRNSHNLAEEMGNSAAVVRTYYDAVVSPSVAKLWWKIRPEEPKTLSR